MFTNTGEYFLERFFTVAFGCSIIAIFVPLYWPFTQNLSTWNTGMINCEYWYLLSVLLILITIGGLLLAVGRWYKNRKRQDMLPNEHIFAERYILCTSELMQLHSDQN